MGVAEVVAFDVEAPAGRRLRGWDLIDGDLVERVVDDEATPCRTLDLWFVIAPCAEPALEAALRLAEDPQGARLVPSPLERERARHDVTLERERVQKEAALAENARLREELARRDRGRGG